MAKHSKPQWLQIICGSSGHDKHELILEMLWWSKSNDIKYAIKLYIYIYIYVINYDLYNCIYYLVGLAFGCPASVKQAFHFGDLR